VLAHGDIHESHAGFVTGDSYERALAGERCLGGLDLGSVRDRTAVARFTDLWGFLAITTSHIVSAARAR